MQPREATRTAVKLLGVTVLMFGFGFALVPLYDLMCEVTGLNGKTGDRYVIEQTVQVDENRTVKIQFVTNNNTGMSWVFRPTQGALEVIPGKLNATEFYVHNPANKTIIAQAVPSVTPYRAAKYLHKTECFCFDQQSSSLGMLRSFLQRLKIRCGK